MKKIIYPLALCIAVLSSSNFYGRSVLQHEVLLKKIKTKTNKTINIYQTKNNKTGMYTVRIATSGFLKKSSTFIKDTDPVKDVLVGDLDKNGFDEIYIVTQGVGSGSYESVFGFTSVKDQQLAPITIPALTMKGYMGHDNFQLSGGKLKRTFPIYKDKDSNCCPTGGKNTIMYTLIGTKLVLSK
ncbi:hypothetical protein ACP3T3_00985 [Chryseobacterium sp. CBSDS_008]|uniref:hypothetical protein n=1 Tax=Chryseobacterium sp. CBSDS_008 TaxID=3415265 RepID=UPI003CF26FD8